MRYRIAVGIKLHYRLLVLDVYARSTLQELPVSGLAVVRGVLDYYAAAGENCFDDTLDLFALVSAVVNVHMMRLYADCLLTFRIENDKIRFRADRDRALFGKQAEHFRSGSGSEFDKAIQTDTVFNYSAVVD